MQLTSFADGSALPRRSKAARGRLAFVSDDGGERGEGVHRRRVVAERQALFAPSAELTLAVFPAASRSNGRSRRRSSRAEALEVTHHELTRFTVAQVTTSAAQVRQGQGPTWRRLPRSPALQSGRVRPRCRDRAGRKGRVHGSEEVRPAALVEPARARVPCGRCRRRRDGCVCTPAIHSRSSGWL